MEIPTISPIAIDLGAKYTGVLLPQYQAGEDVTETQISGLLVVNTDKMTWSQQPRRQKRHQMRGFKRRKMAKRLLWLILEHEFDLKRENLPGEAVSLINGLMNRRGFTYLSEEIDETCLQVPARAIAAISGGIFNEQDPLDEQLGRILADPAQARKVLHDDAFPRTKTECRKAIPEQFRDEKTEIVAAWEQIYNACTQVDKSENDGHRPRRDYLANIREEMKASETLTGILPESLPSEALARLMGHISNLQLRVLRKYFNDKKMAGRAYWHPERLHHFFFRWIKSWHAKRGTEERDRQRKILAMRDRSIMEVFTAQEPNLTIPPYEDQNNRRPPRCMSVRLDEAKLDRAAPDWRHWVRALRDSPLNRYLDEAVGGAPLDDPAFLQRLIERSVALDPYQLRLLASLDEPEQRQGKAGFTRLNAVLGADSNEFIDFVRNFFTETREARSGLWFERDNQLLSRCNRVPPQKRKLKPQLLESILGKELSKEAVTALEEEFWNAQQPRIERRTCRGWARVASEKQKEYGVHLKTAGEQQLARLEAGGKPDDRDLALLYKNALAAAQALGDYLRISPAEVSKFASPHSLAQIFNILEGDINGFNKTCAACTAENIWRMKPESVKDRLPNDLHNELPSRLKKAETAARAVRLSSDTTRPFDGQLAAIIDAVAREIAKAKHAQLQGIDGPVHIPLLIEMNQFTFTDELAETKRQRNTKAAKRARELAEKTEEGWQEKHDRIRAASKGVCPYTGAGLGDAGEIDHIVPRSLSRDTRQTVFNSEANLIYCSARGNHKKAANEYFLEDLDKRYLEVQFGTSDIQAIHRKIEQTISPYLHEGRQLRAFSELSEREQMAFRHALFDTKLRDSVIPMLEQRIKTRVNGTQAWLAKRIHHHLLDAVGETGPAIEVSAHHVSADDVQRQRKLIAAVDPRWEKHTPQPAASHVVDAASVFLHALDAEHTRPVLQTVSADSFSDESWRSRVVPSSILVRRLEPRPKYRRDDPASAPIFKDGIYAERFVPLIMNKDGLRAGYSLENSLPAENPEFVFEALVPWIRFRKAPLEDGKYETWHAEAAEQMLYFEIARQAAFDFLARPRREMSEPEQIAAALLESLRFTQQKVPLKKAMLDNQGRKLEAAGKVLNEKDFAITLKLPGKPVPRKTGVAGRIILPAIEDWRAIVEDPAVAPRLGGEAPDDEFWEAIYRHHFPREMSRKYHRKVRKTFSLPRIKSPSGGFRLRRETPDGNAWQLVESAGYSAVGFAKEEGTVDFKSPSPLPSLASSNSVTPLEELIPRRAAEIIYFDDWCEISLDENMKEQFQAIAYAPGSKDRFDVEFSITRNQFLRFIRPCLQIEQEDPYELPSEVKIAEKEIKASWVECFGEVLGTPRSDQPLILRLLRTGERITFQTKSSPSKKMRELYGNAYASPHHN